jgi:hypothetical protein
MQYNSPEVIYPLDEDLACLPKLFGYPEAVGEEVFPWQGYPRCSELVSDPYPIISLDLERNLVAMNCTGSFPGKFVLGPTDERKLVRRHDVEDVWEVKTYSGRPESIGVLHEYAFATCEEDSEIFDRAVYLPRYNVRVLGC